MELKLNGIPVWQKLCLLLKILKIYTSARLLKSFTISAAGLQIVRQSVRNNSKLNLKF